jgi:KaiC/GvpD/RAD55 family RecA-like ATPase
VVFLERVKSGVPGFDNLVDGGFPRGFAVLLSGAPGTGKSIFCLNFLHEGLKEGERCAYVTYSQSPKDIMDQASQFGWNMKDVEFIELKPEEFEEALSGKKYDRLVLDSLSSVSVMTRDSLGRFIKKVKDMGCTAIVISELPMDMKWLSRDTISEFLCDGVVVLRSVEAAGEVKNLLKVEKMRSTKIDQESHIYKISDKGFELKTYKIR